jgi:NhaP-type Na+/H+ or K+/H+ antiporter
MKSSARIANAHANCTQMQTQMTLKQKTCSNKSVMHMKCCQILKLAAGTTALAMLAFLVLAQVADQTHSAEAAVLATSLKHSSAVAVAGVIKQVHRVDKTLRSLLA